MAKITKKPVSNELEDLKAKLARALADYSNLEKRFEKESSQIIRFANSNILEDLLPIKDNLERASSIAEDPGITMILSDLNQLLKKNSVEEISTEEFDPNTMECEEVVAGKKNKIITVSQKGYMMGDRLLRRAKVKVGSGINKK